MHTPRAHFRKGTLIRVRPHCYDYLLFHDHSHLPPGALGVCAGSGGGSSHWGWVLVLAVCVGWAWRGHLHHHGLVWLRVLVHQQHIDGTWLALQVDLVVLLEAGTLFCTRHLCVSISINPLQGLGYFKWSADQGGWVQVGVQVCVCVCVCWVGRGMYF